MIYNITCVPYWIKKCLIYSKLSCIMFTLIFGPVAYAQQNTEDKSAAATAELTRVTSTRSSANNPSAQDMIDKTNGPDEKNIKVTKDPTTGEDIIHVEEDPKDPNGELSNEKYKQLYGKTVPAWGMKSGRGGDYIDENERIEMAMNYLIMIITILVTVSLPSKCPVMLAGLSILAMYLGGILGLVGIILSVAKYQNLATKEITIMLDKDLDIQKKVFQDLTIKVKNYIESTTLVKNILTASFALFCVALALSVLEIILLYIPVTKSYAEANDNFVQAAAKVCKFGTKAGMRPSSIDNTIDNFLNKVLIKFAYAQTTPPTPTSGTTTPSVPALPVDNLPTKYQTDHSEVRENDFDKSPGGENKGLLGVAGGMVAAGGVIGVAMVTTMKKAAESSIMEILPRIITRIAVSAILVTLVGVNVFHFMQKRIEVMEKRKEALIGMTKEFDRLMAKPTLNTKELGSFAGMDLTSQKKITDGYQIPDNTCFNINKASEPTIDTKCGCSPKCGIASPRLAQIGNIQGASAIAEGLNEGVNYTNKVAGGDQSAYNAVNTANMGKMAMRMGTVTNDLLNKLDQMGKDKKINLPNIANEADKLYQGIRASVKKVLEENGVDNSKLAQLSGMNDKDNELTPLAKDQSNNKDNAGSKNSTSAGAGTSAGSADGSSTDPDALNFNLDSTTDNSASALSKDELENAYTNMKQDELPEEMGEIVKDDGVNMFEIISNRYKRKYEQFLND